MKKDALLYGISGLVVGGGIVWAMLVTSVNSDNRQIMQMMGVNVSRVQDRSAGHAGMSMQDMETELQGKTGDEFDKVFMEMMIVHHEGALGMAEAAKQQAKHAEVKTMANDIIKSQTKEMNNMYQWQVEWGYGSAAAVEHIMEH